MKLVQNGSTVAHIDPSQAIALLETGIYDGMVNHSGRVKQIRYLGSIVGRPQHTPWDWLQAWHKDGRAVLQPYSVTGDYSLA